MARRGLVLRSDPLLWQTLQNVPTYPNVAEIRKRLNLVRDASYGDDAVLGSFLVEALKVCDEAALEGETIGAPRIDIQTIAKLQFIERVLNG